MRPGELLARALLILACAISAVVLLAQGSGDDDRTQPARAGETIGASEVPFPQNWLNDALDASHEP